MDSTAPPKRRNVKSGSAIATDAHERGKDFLNETEMATCSRPPSGDDTASAITC